MGCEDHRGDVWLLVVDSFGRGVVGFRDADEASTFLAVPLIGLALVVRQLGPRGVRTWTLGVVDLGRRMELRCAGLRAGQGAGLRTLWLKPRGGG